MSGDVWNAGTAGTGVVWDARNNGIAYVLDYARIRVVDFANPSSATAVTTLALPSPYTSITSNSGTPLTTSLCGDRLNPQTLYLPQNQNGRYGNVLAIKLDFVNGALDAQITLPRTLTARYALQASP